MIQDGQNGGEGVSVPDRATAVEPVPVSPLRDGIANAVEYDCDGYMWGCEYCQNDGKLTSNNACPKCDAQYFDEAQTQSGAD